MDFNSYQKEALRTDRVPGRDGVDDATSLIVPMLGLAGETGQLLSEYKKHLRDGEAHRLFKERVSEELGDLLWYIANVASKFDLSLSDVAAANLAKVKQRWASERTEPLNFRRRVTRRRAPATPVRGRAHRCRRRSASTGSGPDRRPADWRGAHRQRL